MTDQEKEHALRSALMAMSNSVAKADLEHRYSDRDCAQAVIKKWKNDHASLRPCSYQRLRTWVKQVYSRF